MTFSINPGKRTELPEEESLKMKTLFPLAVLLFVAAAGLSAAPGLSWSTSLDTIASVGETRYVMEEPAAGVSSELIFPLNTLMAGATLRGESSEGRLGWAFEASVAMNLLAPLEKMEDWDWWMFPGTPKVPFSYTESDASMFWLTASASWQPVLAAGGWGELSAVVGYRFQYLHQDINGYNGWIYDDLSPVDGQPELYSQSGSGLVLTYWIMYNMPTAGLAVSLFPAAGISVRAEAGLAIPYVSDEDDHVLRSKLSTASGLGFGGYAGLLARYRWGYPESRIRPYLELAGTVFTAKANTRQTQTYYAGATEELPGTSHSGIDHQISIRQFGVILTVGLEF
ncbi:MAG: hypothetical protein NT080_00150 [Spirochaetes bacterium]|nr:hypothetical protein [Spirochaetota bacterium]